MKIFDTHMTNSRVLRACVISSLFVFLASTLGAQTLPTYYVDGTGGPNVYPLGSTTNKTEHHFLPNEFTGAYAGNITKVYMKRGNSTAASTFTNLTFKMAQTTSTTFPSTTTFWTPMTTVYSATTTIPAGNDNEWFGVSLPTPFPYNPNQSLVVQVCQEGYTTAVYLRYASMSAPPYRRIWGSGGCSITSGTGTDASRYCFGFDMNPALPDDAGISKLLSPVNFCAGTHNLQVELFNYGTNTLNNVTVNWTLNGQPQTPVNWSTPLPSLGTAPVTLATNMNFQSGVPYNLVVWTSNPNSTSDSFPGNDTLVTTLKAALSGTFTIGGASPDYANFASAVNDLNANGVCGPVIFNVRSGTYNERVVLQSVSGASAVNTITFQSETGNRGNVTITYASAALADNGVVNLGSAKFVTFKNMTIQNLATNNTYCAVVQLESSTDCSIESCELIGPKSTYTSYYAAVVNGYTGDNDRTTIRDCGIRNGGIGMYMYGSGSYSNTQDDCVIEGNEITGTYYIPYLSYYLGNEKFHDNVIISTDNTGGYYYYNYLAYFYMGHDASIERNQFYGQRSAAGYVYGVRLYYLNYPSYYPSAGPSRFVNNFVTTTGGSALYYNYGSLSANYCENTLIAHNTVHNSVPAGAQYTDYGLMYSYYGANNRYLNNIFYSESSLPAWYVTPTSAVGESDYNAFYTGGTTLAYWNGNRNDIAALQTASGMDKNSVVKNVFFKNPATGDLHLISPSEDDVNMFGTLLSEVTDDIDHEARVQPYKGADEACYITPGSVTYDFVDKQGMPAAYVEAPGTIGVHYVVAFPEFDATIQMTVSFFNVITNQLAYQTVLTAQKAYGITLDGVQYITIPASLPSGAYKVEINFWTKNSCNAYRDYMPYPSALLVVPEGRIPCVVWPGDANNDGVVSYADRRDLNRYIYDANLRTSWLNGPPRYQADQEQNPFTYLEWKPQAAAPWYTPDGCYMDTDGNGVINNLDYIAMKLNWSKMTPWYGGSPKTDVSAVSSFAMDQNYPNPFNPSTTIRYNAAEASQVRLVVTDALGREVAKLVDGRVDAGQHEVQFDGSTLSSGTYIATMTMTGVASGMTFVKTIKMALAK